MITEAVYGCTDNHVVELEPGIGINCDMAEDWASIKFAASEAGFDLCIASGFRSMHRQRLIWERKLAGDLPVYNDQGTAIDINACSLAEQFQFIMRWSALPGASRHHWGTDIDIYDKAAMPSGYHLQLVPAEYNSDGLFAPMMAWLKRYLAMENTPDFFFPYAQDTGGIGVEPWHISFRPLANAYQAEWTKAGCLDALSDWSVLTRAIDSCAIEPNNETSVLTSLIDPLYDRFIEPSIFALR